MAGCVMMSKKWDTMLARLQEMELEVRQAAWLLDVSDRSVQR